MGNQPANGLVHVKDMDKKLSDLGLTISKVRLITGLSRNTVGRIISGFNVRASTLGRFKHSLAKAGYELDEKSAKVRLLLPPNAVEHPDHQSSDNFEIVAVRCTENIKIITDALRDLNHAFVENPAAIEPKTLSYLKLSFSEAKHQLDTLLGAARIVN